jgi:hypothetical protein
MASEQAEYSFPRRNPEADKAIASLALSAGRSNWLFLGSAILSIYSRIQYLLLIANQSDYMCRPCARLPSSLRECPGPTVLGPTGRGYAR